MHVHCQQTACHEGCACPAGTVLRGDKCVDPEECPCVYLEQSYKTGSRIKQDCNWWWVKYFVFWYLFIAPIQLFICLQVEYLVGWHFHARQLVVGIENLTVSHFWHGISLIYQQLLGLHVGIDGPHQQHYHEWVIDHDSWMRVLSADGFEVLDCTIAHFKKDRITQIGWQLSLITVLEPVIQNRFVRWKNTIYGMPRVWFHIWFNTTCPIWNINHEEDLYRFRISDSLCPSVLVTRFTQQAWPTSPSINLVKL